MWVWWDPDLVASMGGRTVLDLTTDGGELWAAMSYAEDLEGQRADGGVSRLIDPAWEHWPDGVDGFRSFADRRITGDVRSVFVDSRGYVWAGTYDVDPQRVIGDNPLYEAVVNRWDPVAADWSAWGWDYQGWIASLSEDSFGRIWAGTTRDVDGEYWPGDGVRDNNNSDALTVDDAEQGVYVYDDAEEVWQALAPVSSGLADEQITDIALDPTTGHVWVALRNHGVSEYVVGQSVGPSPTPRASDTPRPTRTPCPDGACATDTPAPTATISPVPSVTPTLLPMRTLAPAEATRVEATLRATESTPGGNPDERSRRRRCPSRRRCGSSRPAWRSWPATCGGVGAIRWRWYVEREAYSPRIAGAPDVSEGSSSSFFRRRFAALPSVGEGAGAEASTSRRAKSR